MNWALEASPDHPILIDKFLEDAIEVDVDAICDGQITVIGGIMEHIEEAGIHSGDSACVLPPYSLTRSIQEEIKAQTRALAAELGVIGLLNIQFAVKDNQVYVLEVNPRASRTVPFVSKATGVSLAKLATKVMLGRTLQELGFTEEVEPPYFAVKESVFPFRRFPGVDPLLGPEMRSTGEVMGIDEDFGLAFAKSQLAAGQIVPLAGGVVFSVKDADKPQAVDPGPGLCGRRLSALCHQRHRGVFPGPRPDGHGSLQGPGRPAPHHRPHQEPGNLPADQYPGRPRDHRRFPLHPPRGPGAQHPLYHHHGRGPGHPGLHPGPETGQTGSQDPPGVSCDGEKIHGPEERNRPIEVQNYR